MTRLRDSLAQRSRRGSINYSTLGSLADIEVQVKIGTSNGAVLRDVVVGCDSELYAFVVLVRSFAIEVCQNGHVWRIQTDFLTKTA